MGLVLWSGLGSVFCISWVGALISPVWPVCAFLHWTDLSRKCLKFFSLQGMGGQLNYFGFWLDDDFGSGHSRGQPSCTTYGSPQLSAEEEFKLDKLEAWGVGLPPENEVSCYN